MNRGSKILGVLIVQLIFVGAFAGSYAALSKTDKEQITEMVTGKAVFKPIKIDHLKPYTVTPKYNDPTVVSDEDLAAVLSQVMPIFDKARLRPNIVEHALRTWHEDAEFQNPDAVSGAEMRDFLVDTGKLLLSWKDQKDFNEYRPLVADGPAGAVVEWSNHFTPGISVHHDHTLACLSEAGVNLNQPVRTAGRPNMTLHDMVNQAVYDFNLDEKETEWSAMSFALWLPPQKEWVNGKGRKLSFDMIAERQLRGHQQLGVCGGTHRLYSLMALLRLDEEHGPILSKDIRKKVYTHLLRVGQRLEETQFEDGHWPYNWPDGHEAVAHPADHPESRNVIATGHHLEWLSIAPREMHPPRECIVKAAKWLIKTTTEKTRKQIQRNYTFYSHVGNALAMWRGTRPAAFWMEWEAKHPFDAEKDKAREEQKEAALKEATPPEHNHGKSKKANAPSSDNDIGSDKKDAVQDDSNQDDSNKGALPKNAPLENDKDEPVSPKAR